MCGGRLYDGRGSVHGWEIQAGWENDAGWLAPRGSPLGFNRGEGKDDPALPWGFVVEGEADSHPLVGVGAKKNPPLGVMWTVFAFSGPMAVRPPWTFPRQSCDSANPHMTLTAVQWEKAPQGQGPCTGHAQAAKLC